MPYQRQSAAALADRQVTLIAPKRQVPSPVGSSPVGRGQVVSLRLLPDLLAPLDSFRARQGGISRPEAIGLLVRDGLLQADAIPVDPSQQSSLEPEKGFRRKKLNGANDRWDSRRALA